MKPESSSNRSQAALHAPKVHTNPILEELMRDLTGQTDSTLEELDRLGLAHTLKNWLRVNHPGGVALMPEIVAAMPDEIRMQLPGEFSNSTPAEPSLPQR